MIYRYALFHKSRNVVRSAIQSTIIARRVESHRHGSGLLRVVYIGTYSRLHSWIVQIADVVLGRIPEHESYVVLHPVGITQLTDQVEVL